MKGLTAKQQAVWDLKRPIEEGGQGKSYSEISALLGISKAVINNKIVVIHKKLGIVDAARRSAINSTVEVQNPEKAAAVIDAMTEIDPYRKISEAFAACGLPQGV